LFALITVKNHIFETKLLANTLKTFMQPTTYCKTVIVSWKKLTEQQQGLREVGTRGTLYRARWVKGPAYENY